MQDQRPIAIALMGPTASGKTALAVDWAERMGTQIISVDSALVYRGLDIGAAKPDATTQARVKHHLIDIRDPSQIYSAAEFASDAALIMHQLSAKGRVPLLVGGTGLYFRALFEGLAKMPESDPIIRAVIERESIERGWPALHAELVRVDPHAAARIHATDTQRIARALEVFRISGTPISEWQKSALYKPFPFRVLKLAIAPKDRSVLHNRIAKRFEGMLNEGFLEEVQRLRTDPRLNPDLPSIRAIGYRQAWFYLNGVINSEEFRAQTLAATRQLAKRQLTWLRGMHDVLWFDPHAQNKDIETVLRLFLR